MITGFVSILAAMAIYGVLHSVLASRVMKLWAESIFGAPAARTWYRLFYNLVAVLTLLPVFWLIATTPDQPLWSVSQPWASAFRLVQLVGVIGAVIAVMQTGAFSFAGFSQLFEGGKGEERGVLVTGGLYRLVRHPIYTFSLLVLWFSPTFTVNSLAFALGATGYFLIGMIFEERKLTQEFGQSYIDYKSKTPALVPGLKLLVPSPIPVRTREDR